MLECSIAMSVSADHLEMPHDMVKLVKRNALRIALEMQRKCVVDSGEFQCGCKVQFHNCSHRALAKKHIIIELIHIK